MRVGAIFVGTTSANPPQAIAASRRTWNEHAWNNGARFPYLLNFITLVVSVAAMDARKADDAYDVCVVGGGPAGLSAALILARCQRQVIVIDSNRPRNYASRGLHGFLTRDGISPQQLREIGRDELGRYPNVALRDGEIVAAHRNEHGFELRPREGDPIHAQVVLLATGRSDVLPDKPGFRELYGRGIYHCPVCDGWEQRQQDLVVLGEGESAAELALSLLTWSPRITLCTDGPAKLREVTRERLRRHAIAVREDRLLAANAGDHGFLASVRLADGSDLPCGALFFDAESPQKSPLAEILGCRLDESGAVACEGPAACHVPGVVAGNVRRGIHLAITAAAEGVEAALEINRALLRRQLAGKNSGGVAR